MKTVICACCKTKMPFNAVLNTAPGEWRCKRLDLCGVKGEYFNITLNLDEALAQLNLFEKENQILYKRLDQYVETNVILENKLNKIQDILRGL